MDRWTKIGIIAGDGMLPVRLIEICRTQGHDYHLIRLKGARDNYLGDYVGDDFAVAEIGKIFRSLRENNCDSVVMAGFVQRPDFSSLRPDWRGVALLPKVTKAAAKGDGALLAALVDIIEAEGFNVIGVEEVLADITPQTSLLGEVALQKADYLDIQKAVSLIKAIGPFDVGQGAVVCEGQVFAIEAAEGTDQMLERCIGIKDKIGTFEKKGVLVKIPKPDQEMRVDLPTIGVDTIEIVHRAGLAGIAIAAGKSLILDKESVIALANEKEIFLYGYSEQQFERDLLKHED